MRKSFNLVWFFLVLLGGCQTEVIKPVPDEAGTQYYPLRAGDYWIYRVVETRYRNQLAWQPGDSSVYFVREQIDTIYQDLTGQPAYQFTRSRRPSATAAWGADSVFVVNKSASDVRLYYNNVRWVPFVFPVLDGKKWNAHVFNVNSQVTNPAQADYYTFAAPGQPFTVGDTTYQNTVKVIQRFNENAIERQDAYEVYAYGVGRIYKQVLAFDYCSDPARQNACAVGEEYIVKGSKRTEQLQAYGSLK